MITVVETDPSKLPQWQGRPVPWATKWTGETYLEPFVPWLDATGEVVVGYNDGGEDNRDEHRYLWRREGIRRGGEPQFAQLNAYRQKASMRTPRCHVCGSRLRKGSPIHWLIPPGALSIPPESDVPTLMSPPTCDGCVPLARRLCPHLRAHGSQLLEVRDFRLYGVVGEAFLWDRGPKGLELRDRVKDLVVEYGKTYRDVGPKNFVARQQIVALTDFTVVES